MTDPKAPDKAAGHTPTPEDYASLRVKELQATLTLLQTALRTSQGKLANRDPTALQRLTYENENLTARIRLLEAALLALAAEAHQPKTSEEEKTRLNLLRHAALDYCKKTNVDPELWKNLES